MRKILSIEPPVGVVSLKKSNADTPQVLAGPKHKNSGSTLVQAKPMRCRCFIKEF
jgi:hypothetical protein